MPSRSSEPSLLFDGGIAALEDHHMVIRRVGRETERLALRGADACRASIQTGEFGGPALVVTRCGPTIVCFCRLDEGERFLAAVEARR